MATTYFLGAGTSAADGLPVTSQLNFGVAAWLRDNEKRKPELRTFYKDLYKVKASDIERAADYWDDFIDDRTIPPPGDCELPNLIETLSLIDVCLGDEQSLGLSSKAKGNGFKYEMNSTFLRLVRRQLTFAIATAVRDATYKKRSPLTHQFVETLRERDALISTNWDMLLDRCLVAAWKRKMNLDGRSLRVSPIRYHCVGEQPVNWRGRNLPKSDDDASTLLRLHGALNWFGCASCGNVYVNLEGYHVMDEEHPRKEHDECDCGAGLLNVMITPSYLKDYRNVSVRSVWREAQKRLERADRWVFVGYSLPTDDFHIRAMLMRALRAQATRKKPKLASIHVFLAEGACEAAERYRDLFRLSPPKIEMSGFEGCIKQRKKYERRKRRS